MKSFIQSISIIFLLVLCWYLSAQNTGKQTADVKGLLAQKQFDKELPMLRASLMENESKNDWAAFAVTAISIASAFNGQSRFDTCVIFLEDVLQKLEAVNFRNTKVGSLYSYLAINHIRMDNYQNGLEAYEAAIRIFEKTNPFGVNITYCYKNIAQIFIRRMQYNTANDYLRAALRSDTSGLYRQINYFNISTNYFWQDSITAAYENYEKAHAESHGDLLMDALTAACGAEILLKKQQTSQARKLLLQALPFFIQNKWPSDLLRCHTSLAEIAHKTNRPAEAEQHYRTAETIGTANFKNRKSREMAKLYTEWGDFCRNTNQPDRALDFYQNAIIQAFPKFENPNPTENPSPADAPIELYALTAPARKADLLLESLRSKHHFSNMHFQISAFERPDFEKRYRQNAAQCFDLAFAAAEQLRQTYGTDEAKIYLAKTNQNLARDAALNLLELSKNDAQNPFSKNENSKYLHQLFTFLEKNRAAALRDALRQQRAQTLVGVPDSLLDLEKSLRLDGVDLTNSRAAETDSAKIVRLDDLIFKNKRRLENLLSDLAARFPDFEKYNSAGAVTDAATLQISLPDSAAVLSWFDATDRYICLVLKKSGLTAFEIQVEVALQNRLSAFVRLLADKVAQENDPAHFFEEAHFFYKKLLPGDVVSGISNLTIIPDGLLCYLPFEALLTEKHAGKFAAAPYLLKKTAVRYNWAADLPQTQNSTAAAKNGILQLAPFAFSGRGNLPKLAAATEDIDEKLSPHRISGDAATVASFDKNAADFQVLHLSTHAQGGRKPNIEFADRALTLPEIYARRFRADLVSLSACETNLGELATGEGALSLSRAFAYAGAKSLLAGHWKVSDRATATIFSQFYKNLKMGLTKSESLRRAKLSLLAAENSDASKSPFFWAAITLTGADGVVDLKNHGFEIWKWAVLGAILVGLGLFFWRKKLGGLERG